MKATDTREVEVILHLRIPDMLPDAVVDRLRVALVTRAADLPHVIEAGVGNPTPLNLTFLLNEVLSAADKVMDMQPADEVWCGMTCTEAEALACIFAAAGRHDVYRFIIEQHAQRDEPDELTFHKEMHDD